jgi:hypothetical protein
MEKIFSRSTSTGQRTVHDRHWFGPNALEGISLCVADPADRARLAHILKVNLKLVTVLLTAVLTFQIENHSLNWNR